MTFVLSGMAAAKPATHAKTTHASGTDDTKLRLELAKETTTVNGLMGQVSSRQELKQDFLNSVAHESGVSTQELANQIQKTGMNYGDLLVANAIATGASKKFDQVEASHSSLSWAEIAGAYKVGLDTIITKLKNVSAAVAKAESDLQAKDQKAQAAADKAARDAAAKAAAARHRRHR
ncbi:MAG: hypothetical protein WCO56_23190 [Verrucomicrobiota bacterium]